MRLFHSFREHFLLGVELLFVSVVHNTVQTSNKISFLPQATYNLKEISEKLQNMGWGQERKNKRNQEERKKWVILLWQTSR